MAACPNRFTLRPATIASVSTVFHTAGRLAVRFRWAIVLAWVAGTVAAMALLPSLSDVTQSDNTSFLPASALSEQAAQLASPLQGASLTAVTVVAARSGGVLTGADQAAIARLSAALARAAKGSAVRDAGQSADGRAEQLTVLAALAQSGGLATSQQASLVAGLRDVIRAAALPAGLAAHTAGPVATRVDTNAISGKTGGQVQWFSIIFVVALLMAVFRSALAPLIAVLPALVVVLVAERLTAEAAIHGLGVSQIASLLLIVLVLGAGTDYALFLMFRVREEMRAGLPCNEAIVLGVARVGETITFSAPEGSDSAQGNALLTEHFPQSAANPTVIVLRLRQPVWAAAADVATAERQLAADPQFTAVSGPFDANGTALTAAQYAALHASYGPPRGLTAAAGAQVPRARLAAYQAYRASGSYVSADGYTISFAAIPARPAAAS